MKINSFEEIKHNNELLAIIIRSDYKSESIKFFTPQECSQQLGFLPHKKGSIIKAHFHKPVNKTIDITQEVLFIRKGKILVNFYTNNRIYITSREINEGDIVFLCKGGHGIKVIEDTEIIEVKQGPYLGKEGDKESFEGIENDTG